MEEIEVNGNKYVLKSKIKNIGQQVKPNKKGLTYCVIRTYSAGVFAGYVDRKVQGKQRTLYNARRLWKWQAKKGIDCSSIAEHGVNPDGCTFSEIRKEIDVTEVIEIQPCTKESQDSIESIGAELND